MGSTLVYIYSAEHQAYWRTGGAGYTLNAAEAGVWTREEAEAKTSHCGPEKKVRLVPVAECAASLRANLLTAATRIETEDGHLVQRSGAAWYAYPKLDPESPGSGGEVIFTEERKLKPFNSATEAYAACIEARAKYAQRTGGGRALASE